MKGLGVVLPLLASSLVAANPIEQRRQAASAQTVQQDVHRIDLGVYNLRKDLKNYKGGLLSETPIGVDLIGIHDANRKGYANINDRKEPFSQAESRAIVNYLQQTIAKDMPASVAELMAKKPHFQSSGQDALIVASLKSLQYDHDTLSAAITKLLTGNQEDAYNMALSIHNAIQHGINHFGNVNAGVAKDGLRKRDAQPGSGWDHADAWAQANHGGAAQPEAWAQGHHGGWPAVTPSQANWRPAPTPSQVNWGPHGNSGSWGGQGREGGGWGEGDRHHGKRDASWAAAAAERGPNQAGAVGRGPGRLGRTAGEPRPATHPITSELGRPDAVAGTVGASGGLGAGLVWQLQQVWRAR
ncbi:Hydrophobic surface binding protein A [Teratosphaeria destructans]|uniref:Hydrophobic surface binding protein A n=1 Tax=Teratosphaeria destructans TaxID=418781 RepID=A0A9W7T175_9PEZI|nr:Hydrophobic surface binding protein A [Teratosphaeria destructans]